MTNLVLFLLGQKGVGVLNAAISYGCVGSVALVVIGSNKDLIDDCSEEIHQLCVCYGIRHCRRESATKLLNGQKKSVAVAAGWRWLINEQFQQLVVFHDSLLPKYRGFNPLVTALLNRDKEVGVTAFIANGKFDCGDIIGQKIIGLSYPVKISEVSVKISELYFNLARDIFEELFLTNFLVGERQEEKQASYSVWRDEDDYRIDWTKSSEYISHMVNCVSYPYKGASALCESKLVRILSATPTDDVQIINRDPGKVIFQQKEKPVIICGTGLLLLDAAVDENGQSILPLKSFRTRFR